MGSAAPLPSLMLSSVRYYAFLLHTQRNAVRAGWTIAMHSTTFAANHAADNDCPAKKSASERCSAQDPSSSPSANRPVQSARRAHTFSPKPFSRGASEPASLPPRPTLAVKGKYAERRDSLSEGEKKDSCDLLIHHAIQSVESSLDQMKATLSQTGQTDQPEALYDSITNSVRSACWQARHLSEYTEVPDSLEAVYVTDRRKLAVAARARIGHLASAVLKFAKLNKVDTDVNDELLGQLLQAELLAYTHGTSVACDALTAAVQTHRARIEAVIADARKEEVPHGTQNDLLLRSLRHAVDGIVEVCASQPDRCQTDVQNTLRSLLSLSPVLQLWEYGARWPQYGSIKRCIRLLDDPIGLCQWLLRERHPHMSMTDDKHSAIDHSTWTEAISTVIVGMSSDHRLTEAYRIYIFAKRNGMRIRQRISRDLLNALMSDGEEDMADSVERILLLNANSAGEHILEAATYRLLAWRSASAGQRESMETYLQALHQYYPKPPASTLRKGSLVTQFALEMRIHEASARGDPEACFDLLSKEYNMRPVRPLSTPLTSAERVSGEALEKAVGSSDDEGKQATTKSCRLLFQAYINAERTELAVSMIKLMEESQIEVTIGFFNFLMESFIRNGDSSSALTVLKRLQDNDVKPNRSTFLLEIKLHARSGNVERATNALRRAMQLGFVPTRSMYNSVLHAHVQSGSFEGAVTLFQEMLASTNPRLRPSLADFNTMLRLHSVRPVAIQLSMAFLYKMIAYGYSPNAQTFTILLGAAWRARAKDVAEQLFSLAETHLGRRSRCPDDAGAAAQHFVAMIRGYLDMNKFAIARNYLRELSKRDLHMSDDLRGQVMGLIVRSFLRHRPGERGLKAAEELGKKLTRNMPTTLFQVNLSLLRRAANDGRTDIIDRIVRDAEKRDVDVPLSSWMMLLNTFKGKRNADEALGVWDYLFKTAVDEASAEPTSSAVNVDAEKQTGADDVTMVVPSSKRHSLDLSLSILIDILTEAGMHEEIAKVWVKCRQHGFAFSPENWNGLVQAMLRGGRLVDACDVVERVLDADPPHVWTSSAERNERYLAVQLPSDRDPADCSDERRRQDDNDRKSTKISIEECSLASFSSPRPESSVRHISSVHDATLRLPSFRGEAESLFEERVEDRAQGRPFVQALYERKRIFLPRLLERPDAYYDASLRERHAAQGDHQSETDAAATYSDRQSNGEHDDHVHDRVPPLDNVIHSEAKADQLLSSLKVRTRLVSLYSPWYASKKTMGMLSDVIARARSSTNVYPPTLFPLVKGHATNSAPNPDLQLDVDTLLHRHPRVAQLLSIYRRKVSADADVARRRAERTRDSRTIEGQTQRAEARPGAHYYYIQQKEDRFRRRLEGATLSKSKR